MNVKNDPFMTRGGGYHEQVVGRSTVNLQKDPWMTHGPRTTRDRFGGQKDQFGLNLQVTVCYVTNLKDNDWGCGRRMNPYVVAELLGTRQKFKAHSKANNTVPPDVLARARHTFPTNFDHTGVFMNVTRGMKMRFRIQEDRMMGASDLCEPFVLDVSQCGKCWDSAWEEFLPTINSQDPNSSVGMKVRVVAVKDVGSKLYAKLEDHGYPQKLTVLAVMQQQAEAGQTDLEAEVSPAAQKRFKLKPGDNVFIAPEVNGKREMARMLKFITKHNRQFIHLDTRLRHPHGVGTTLAVRSRDPGWCGENYCGAACLHCFEHCKICTHDCMHGAGVGCMISFWSCCICCIECRMLWGMCCAWCLGRNSLIDLRRQCAKRCNLNYDPAVADDSVHDSACCCIPLRTAVFLLSIMSFILALISFFFPSAAEGIDVKSHVVSGVVDLFGLVMGPLGAVGAWELKANLLKMYNLFQFARLFAKLYMMYTDAFLLANCELWRTDINAAIRKYGWNPHMYDIAMANSCFASLVAFVVTNTFLFWLYIYLISLTRRLIWDCDGTPKYLLSMPKETPSGVFYSYSRTQGRNKPPYGAIDGSEVFGNSPGVVGQPVGLGQPMGLYKPLPFNHALANVRTPGQPHFTY